MPSCRNPEQKSGIDHPYGYPEDVSRQDMPRLGQNDDILGDQAMQGLCLKNPTEDAQEKP
jgi:hypothetical protein